MNTLEILTLLLVVFAALWKAIHNIANIWQNGFRKRESRKGHACMDPYPSSVLYDFHDIKDPGSGRGRHKI